MNIDKNWEARLLARHPLGDLSLREEGFNVRSWAGKNGEWPRAVARQALYLDYQGWFAQEMQGNLKFLIDNNLSAPVIPTELQFFIAMGPWLYVDGKDWHVKNYNIKASKPINRGFARVQVRRYFVRLVEWERHVSTFEACVNRSIRTLVERYDPT